MSENQNAKDDGLLSPNQRDLLDLVRRNQPVRRSDLTEMTNLTQQSVHRLVASLEDLGLVSVEPSTSSRPGKPSPNLSLNAKARASLGILVNTDSVAICIVGFDCAPRAFKRLSIDVSIRESALDLIRNEVVALLEQEQIPYESLCGLGFTLPGYFVEDHIAFNAPEPLRDWSLVDFRPELEAAFGVPVFLENSATAGAIGETLGPLGAKYRDFVYLGFDYGFGGSIIINGNAHLGRAGNAGELSSIFMGEEARRRPALRFLIDHLARNGIAVLGVDDLRRNFDPAWPGVEDWIAETMPQLNRLVVGLTGVVDPEAIVFGGQIAPQLAEILISRVRFPESYRYGAPPPLPDLVPGSVSDDPAASGVALLPLKYTYFR